MILSLTRGFAIGGCIAIASASSLLADGPADNQAENVRPIPPPGVDIETAELNSLRSSIASVRDRWQQLMRTTKSNHQDSTARLKDLEAEVLVFPRAVEMTIEQSIFYSPRAVADAKRLLQIAEDRIDKIADGASWAEVVGLRTSDERQLIAGGFRSKIDDSFQPYGVVIPPNVNAMDASPIRMDLWLHGRGEKVSELAFLNKHSGDPKRYRTGNEPSPISAIVAHPYGRYSNAFKFAGEVDVLELSDYLQRRIAIDKHRIAIRGFSMGGAGCWQIATHYSDRFFAATPGAGFSETPLFLDVFQGEDAAGTAPDYQKTLWQLYDCPPWASNLRNLPTIAYSGEIDRQKQAADVMEAALAERGIELVHLIGPQTAHKIHPDSQQEIARRLDLIERQVSSSIPRNVHLTILTLRYSRMHWIEVTGMEEHWSPAIVNASILSNSTGTDDQIAIECENVSRLRVHFDSGQWPGKPSGQIAVTINGQPVVNSHNGPTVRSDRSLEAEFQLDGTWKVASDDSQTLRKRPRSQGPIDDAFMDRFVFVLPTGTSGDPAVEQWIQSESKHAMDHWRLHFRGDVRMIKDTDVDVETMANQNLILFGDATSNAVIARLLPKLPLQWTNDTIRIGKHEVSSVGHVPAIIYPNPEAPKHYIVINSGFTFREYDYLNNARQTPKLPDWALIDIREGANSRDPGKVISAGFFNESWQPE
ncbi:prolyl oligopeptidase family serine peptidase [Rhodopirellula sp. JC740]|uniref:Prolyl oligopeptidase family serine peptidase n=1 Tax=Rhodopirellula halodulae TaxID=2894198 RepID=A0ABS8NEV1_9BACT|nr:prolyl oligopeptidase family serine peptidase [Rhodopirellula sp. JC740]MCC9641368.1 prolyl oligopeptidase family serine peptidase [Rhodopirellula sp. JC740]